MSKGELQPNGTYSFPLNTTCMYCGKKCEVWKEVSIEFKCGGKYDYWCYCSDCDVETFHPSSGYDTENASDI